MEPTHAPLDPSTAKRARRFGPIRVPKVNPRDLSDLFVIGAAGVLLTVFHRRLRRANARLEHAVRTWVQAVLDQMPEGIAITDASGRIVVESRCLQVLSAGEPFAHDRFGNRVTVALRRPWGDHVLPDDSPMVRAITHDQTTPATEFTAQRADGQSVPVLVSAAPIRDAGGSLAGAAMIVRDISARRAFERLREEWAALVVHDLQQPISAIVLRSDILLRSGVSEDQRAAVAHIRSMAVRLSSMVNDLNDSSQLETRRLRTKLARLDLRAVAREAVDHVPGAAVRTTLRVPADAALFVQGDAERLEQVMTNLLSNALKYSPPDTDVVLELREADGDAEVLVCNSGPGIPADELPRLFDRYMRSRTVAREGPKGLGLGLFIAKGLVETHGGRIWVDSAPNQTTFHFKIPLDGAAVPARLTALPATRATSPRRLAPSRL
jgi:signal transduction histidine kinase